jgi:hypothetical protein
LYPEPLVIVVVRIVFAQLPLARARVGGGFGILPRWLILDRLPSAYFPSAAFELLLNLVGRLLVVVEPKVFGGRVVGEFVGGTRGLAGAVCGLGAEGVESGEA